MSWEPECGWATFATRWAVAGGAGAFLAVSAVTATGTPGSTVPDVDSRDVRAIDIEPGVRADLTRITEDAARARAAEQRAEERADGDPVSRRSDSEGSDEREDPDEPDGDDEPDGSDD